MRNLSGRHLVCPCRIEAPKKSPIQICVGAAPSANSEREVEIDIAVFEDDGADPAQEQADAHCAQLHKAGNGENDAKSKTEQSESGTAPGRQY